MQVFTKNDLWTGIPPVTNYPAVGSGLDQSDPYGPNIPIGGQDVEGDSPDVVTDQYSTQVNYSPVQINSSPTMWVMYTPTATGSIGVPLASAAWKFGGTLTWANSAWTLTNPSPSAAGNAPAGATNEYPTWSQLSVLPNPPK